MAASLLAGKTAVVTGASSGIGKALTHALAAEGVRVAMVGRDAGRLERAAAGLAADATAGWACDVRDDAQVRETVAGIEAAWGRIDILANCAGVYLAAALPDLTNEQWDELWATNVSGTLFPTRAVLPGMLARKHGFVIVLSSVAAHRSFANMTGYGATKHAVTGFARALTNEVRQDGVRVVTVLSGPVDTPLWDGKSTPLEREDMLTPAEVARAIVHAMTVSDRQVLEEVLLLPQHGVYH